SEYEQAKLLDPQDPTPWFYDAIHKQTTNRPVEALHDLQKAIDLNDNRAVYRSKLLLDQDLAARSAALGRIYGDLGFEQLGLVEGWKSVNTDPADYSGHRLLADSYATRPLHDIARVSELLQAQLLQPINVTPVQPQLAERNLFALEGAGPAASSFNEFSPLFMRDGFALQASGVVGSNSTYGDEVVHSGLWRNLSYSVGQYHYETDGFRENNDVRVDLASGFIQASLTPRLSIQAELRHREFERGDIDLIADGSFLSDLRLRTISDTFRAGVRYSPNQRSDFIASFIHLDGDNFSQQPSAGNPGTLNNVSGNQGEIQHLFRSNYFSGVTGFGLAQSGFSPADAPDNDTSSSHVNGYLYTYTHYPRDIDWTVGVSVDSLDTSGLSPIEQPNPKAGMIWRAMSDTTLRMAVFRTLKRSLITNQTIEPTQVAGFNQFFDDYALTDAWLYGIAADQKFGPRLFGGLEFIARDLTRPVRPDKETDWNERSYRAYLDSTLTSRLAATVSFHLEEFDGDQITPDLTPLSTTTYLGKAGLRFFDPSGFFSHVEAVYANQWAEWPDVFATSSPIDNEFVLVNAGIGIRLPRRLGIVQLDIRNVFDERFDFQSSGPRSPGFSGAEGQTPPFIPERTLFAHVTLSF
ncbi:MAG: TonB-dependent receptor, partial [Candidatus Binatia bacterium]